MRNRDSELAAAIAQLIKAVIWEKTKCIPRDEINLPSRNEYALTPLQSRMRYLQDD